MANDNKWNRENPWLGLGSYHEGQQLYGRNHEIESLTDIILNHQAIVLYGKSGIGKSSLLQAGVFPKLRVNAMVPIHIRLTHNTEISYTQQIENAISEHLTVTDLIPDTFPDFGLWTYFHRHQFLDTNGKEITPVVVLDQFEEIFTLTDPIHKREVSNLFSELADVLNDVKPDRVIQAETIYQEENKLTIQENKVTGFVIQAPTQSSSFNYNTSPSFRFVFSIRDDSLYLLERNSAKIPALKVNRFNLNALDESNALDVITKPAPGLFSDDEAYRILDGLAYYEYDDYRVVDPAILSLFLFSFFREQGKGTYSDIFERYYQENTLPKLIKESSLSYIEDNLLTDRGNRNQVPLNDIYAAGVTANEIKQLLDSKILKTEKRKGVDYVEFSHDRLCEQALKHRKERESREQNRKMRKRLLYLAFASIATLGLLTFYFWQNTRYGTVLKLNKELTAKSDSLNRSNNINMDLRKKSERRGDSLRTALVINDKQRIRIELQRDSLRASLAINDRQRIRIERQRDSLVLVAQKNKILTDSLRNVISIINSQKEIIAVKSDSIKDVESKNKRLIKSPEVIQAITDYTNHANGIDISKHQGIINWDSVRTNHKNIEFVYIRATEGSDYVDPRYAENIENAKKNGFKVGSYHFLSAKSSTRSQAQNFIRTVNPNQQDLIPVVDVEILGPWTKQELRDSLNLFLNIVENHFKTKPMIYTSESFFKRCLGTGFSGYPLWIAKYSSIAPNIGNKWILWQFTDVGHVIGIGRQLVDLNRFDEESSLEDILYPKK